MDAEELYYELRGFLKDRGCTLSDEADEHLAETARLVAEKFERANKDQYAYWQTYSRRGNELMENMFLGLVSDLVAGRVTRPFLPSVIRGRLKDLEATYPNQGYTDTEPECVLAEKLNPVLDRLGYKELSRFEW